MRRTHRFWSQLLLYPLWVLLGSLPVPAQQYVFEAYRQAAGLGNLTVISLTADSQGFLWVATQNGVYRFLGSDFQRFGQAQGIAEHNVYQVLASPDGAVWATTGENLYRWAGERFVAAGARPMHFERNLQLAVEGPGQLLAVTDGRLERLDYASDGSITGMRPAVSEAQLAAHAELGRIGSINVLPDGAVWMACAHRICAFKDGRWRVWGEAQGVFNEAYSSMAEDPSGNLWAVGELHVIELPQGGERFLDRSPPRPAEDLGQLPLAIDASGRVLISTETGLARWSGGAWQLIGQANGLRSSQATSMLFDPRGDLWMGTFGSGLYQWVGYRDWEGWTDRQGLPSTDVWSVGLFHGGKAVIGTEHGPATVDPATGEARPIFAPEAWKQGMVTSMADQPDGSMLASVASGNVLRIEESPGGQPARVTPVAELATWVYQIFRDPEDHIFVLSRRKGVFAVDDRDPEHPLLTPVAALEALSGPSTSFLSACASRGSDWFLSKTAIYRLADGQWSRIAIEGLPDSAKNSLRNMTCAEDGSLWVIGHEYGIWRLAARDAANGSLNNSGNSSAVWRATELALPAEARTVSVLSIHVMHHGWVWLGTDDGILVWNGESWRHLTEARGLIWNDLDGSAVAEAPDGSIWVGTSGGVAHLLHPGHIFADPPPRIAMIGIRRGALALAPGRSFELPWSRQELSFRFAAPGNPEGVVYSYRIAGLQPSWTESRDTTARFETLPAGSYEFQVMAEDSSSGARSSVLNLRFSIEPPWWRTPWCFALESAAMLLLVLAIYHLRTRQLVARQHRLEQMVRSRTADLEASREKLRLQATRDGLTGLLNRVAILEAFDRERLRAQREDTSIALVLADLDHFKQVNDTRGHLAGDEALRRFASALANAIRPYDYAGRYGGEEFLAVLTGIEPGQLEQRLAALHDGISNLNVQYCETEFRITCSLGVVHLPAVDAPEDQAGAIAAADRCLYRAKQQGRNRFVIYSAAARQTVS